MRKMDEDSRCINALSSNSDDHDKVSQLRHGRMKSTVTSVTQRAKGADADGEQDRRAGAPRDRKQGKLGWRCWMCGSHFHREGSSKRRGTLGCESPRPATSHSYSRYMQWRREKTREDEHGWNTETNERSEMWVTMMSGEVFPVPKAETQEEAARQVVSDIKKMHRAKVTENKLVDVGGFQLVSTVPTFTDIEFRGRSPLLSVVADDCNGKLFSLRAKSIRESCMKKGAGNCMRKQLYHDGPLCSVPPQIGKHCQGWLFDWQYLALTVGTDSAQTVSPHMLVRDNAILDTDALGKGLNSASATRNFYSGLWRAVIAARDAGRELEGKDVSGTAGGGSERASECNHIGIGVPSWRGYHGVNCNRVAKDRPHDDGRAAQYMVRHNSFCGKSEQVLAMPARSNKQVKIEWNNGVEVSRCHVGGKERQDQSAHGGERRTLASARTCAPMSCCITNLSWLSSGHLSLPFLRLLCT